MVSQMAQKVKNLPAMQERQEMWVRSLSQEDALEKEMTTHSSILAWRIPRSEEPGRLQSMGLQRVGHDWATKHACTYTCSHTHVWHMYIHTQLCIQCTRQNVEWPFYFSSICSPYWISTLCVCVQSLRRVRLSVTPWTVACQAPLTVKFSRQEYWNGLPFPSPVDLSNQCFSTVYRLTQGRRLLLTQERHIHPSSHRLWLWRKIYYLRSQ